MLSSAWAKFRFDTDESLSLVKSSKAVISITAAAGIALGVAPNASAEAVTGWTVPTPPANGVIYLHNSTINNSPTIKASSKVYTVNGAVVAPANMAVRAREFKSGALCEVVDYSSTTTGPPLSKLPRRAWDAARVPTTATAS